MPLADSVGTLSGRPPVLLDVPVDYREYYDLGLEFAISVPISPWFPDRRKRTIALDDFAGLREEPLAEHRAFVNAGQEQIANAMACTLSRTARAQRSRILDFAAGKRIGSIPACISCCRAVSPIPAGLPGSGQSQTEVCAAR